MRNCTICLDDIGGKETRHIIAIKGFKYYENYMRDMSSPTRRVSHVWCPSCTNWFINSLRERLEETAERRMDNTETAELFSTVIGFSDAQLRRAIG